MNEISIKQLEASLYRLTKRLEETDSRISRAKDLESCRKILNDLEKLMDSKFVSRFNHGDVWRAKDGSIIHILGSKFSQGISARVNCKSTGEIFDVTYDFEGKPFNNKLDYTLSTKMSYKWNRFKRPPRATLKDVNKVLKNFNVKLLKEKGFFYILSDDYEVENMKIDIARIDYLSIDDWVILVKSRINWSQK